MRLRPSGRQGPVATAFSTFERYQMDEAWTWEHLALTRARVVAGPSDLARDVEAGRARVLAAKAGGKAVRGAVAHMRARIAAAKPPEGPWDAKIGPGRLQDVELAAQALALLAGSTAHATGDQLADAVSAGVIAADGAAGLDSAASLFWALQASGKLLGGGATDPDDLGAGGRAMILRETGADSVAALADRLDDVAGAAAATITEILGERHEAG
jgi:glutamate-ammonia-ligase adenylyltransferase